MWQSDPPAAVPEYMSHCTPDFHLIFQGSLTLAPPVPEPRGPPLSQDPLSKPPCLVLYRLPKPDLSQEIIHSKVNRSMPSSLAFAFPSCVSAGHSFGFGGRGGGRPESTIGSCHSLRDEEQKQDCGRK